MKKWSSRASSLGSLDTKTLVRILHFSIQNTVSYPFGPKASLNNVTALSVQDAQATDTELLARIKFNGMQTLSYRPRPELLAKT